MADFPWCRLYNDILNDRKLERIRRMAKLPRVTIRGAFMSMLAMANDSPQRGELMHAIKVLPVEQCPTCQDGLVRGGICADTGQQEWVICPDCKGRRTP